MSSAVQGVVENRSVNDRFLLTTDTKIVISDVDGTITKEDVMGHVMYAIHQDYTQSGIVRMYNRLSVKIWRRIHCRKMAILFFTLLLAPWVR